MAELLAESINSRKPTTIGLQYILYREVTTVSWMHVSHSEEVNLTLLRQTSLSPHQWYPFILIV